MTLDDFYNRRFIEGEYECRHFAAEVWHYLTGQDVLERFNAALNHITPSVARGFNRLKRPISPCLLIMRRGETYHMGVYISGRIFHLDRSSPRCDLLEVIRVKYRDLRWFR